MGKKRKFVDVFKSSKCQTCASVQNENCQQCTTTPLEPQIVQPAKRSLLHQILRHGFNVQIKSSSPKSATTAVMSTALSTASQNPVKSNGLFQHFKIPKFKDGLNYIKGKDVEPFLEPISKPEAQSDAIPMEIMPASISSRPVSIADTVDTQSFTLAGSNSELFRSTQTLAGVEFASNCDPFPPLKPLFFEVPTSANSVFIGRNWLFTEMERILLNTEKSSGGVIITGAEGTGKTSVLLQLVENSCFGRRQVLRSKNESSALASLASKLVAYHFCQADYRTSCLVPEFVHSIAAQLCQAPRLACYRDFLGENPCVQDLLTKFHCLTNPDDAFCKGILDPLSYLRDSGKIPDTSFLIVVDSICEAEYHRTDTGESISAFLAKHVFSLPNWLKIAVTTRANMSGGISRLIPFHEIRLNGESQCKDIMDYIGIRIRQSPAIKSNVSGSSSGGLKRFQRYLQRVSEGNFLFLKLLLDFIEQGSIQIKSSNFKVLPQTLPELFLHECNLRFRNNQAFVDMEPILSTCLTALNPLNLLEIYHSVNSLRFEENIPWEEFVDSVRSLNNILTPRSDGTYMFFHTSFRDWLSRRGDTTESSKGNQFICDTSLGHAAISYRLSRIEAPLTPAKTLELSHHILQAHIYKGIQEKNRHSIASKDLQAFWLASSAEDLSKTLVDPLCIYYANFKIIRLLLVAGASPNQSTELYKNAPILTVAAAEGNLELTSILLDFGAEVDAVNLDGDTALHLACAKGHTSIASLIVKYGGSLNQLNHESQCPFVKSILNSQTEILQLLLEKMDEPPAAIRRALLAICNQPYPGHELDILEKYLKEFTVNLNSPDGICGENPLTAAIKAGREDVVKAILGAGGNPSAPNLNGVPPINLAAKGDHCSIIKILTAAGCSLDTRDSHKRTPLIEAAAEGQFEAVDLLIFQGADFDAEDEEGLNALSVACLRGNSEVAQYLLAHGMDPNHSDKLGRTPLDLAAYFGSEEIAQLLLDHGSLLERADLQGVRPLDRAVLNRHLRLVGFFLKSGAKINQTTWNFANGKPEIILVLLKKLLDDGIMLCKGGHLREAAQRFQYALRKIPVPDRDHDREELQESFLHLKINFLLQLSRIKRILKEPVDAVSLASDSIKLDPNSYKTWFARSKAFLCLRAVSESLHDCARAIDLATNPEVKKRLINYKENITRDCRRSFSPCQFSTNSLKLLVHTTPHQTDTDGTKPKASTSNCLSARKNRNFL